MDALGLWKDLDRYNWALKPSGCAFPYFCTVVHGDQAVVRERFVLLEGWQTLHDFVRVRADNNFGVYSAPMELPHFELVFSANGGPHLFRNDPGFVPLEVNDPNRRDFVAKLLWEAYGVMMRIEVDRKLPMKFADERAMFARVEAKDGKWSDQPLAIPNPPPYVEKVTFDKATIKAAQDLPMMGSDVLELDFRMLVGVMTRDPRPKCVYELVAANPASPEVKVIDCRVSLANDCGLRELWEGMPAKVLKEFVRIGKVPGEIRVKSGRVFRFLRPLCMELPFKLSIHDKLSSI